MADYKSLCVYYKANTILWASFFPGKERGRKKASETGKEFGWYARKNSQAKVIKLIYNSSRL